MMLCSMSESKEAKWRRFFFKSLLPVFFAVWILYISWTSLRVNSIVVLPTETATLLNKLPYTLNPGFVDSIVPFFRRARREAEPGDITLITHLSCTPHRRLEVMASLLRKWQGPASVAVFIMSDTDFAATAAIYDSEPLLQEHVHLHLVFMSPGLPQLELYKLYGIEMVYPINTLRNLAREYSETDYVFHVDVDFALQPANHAHYRRSVALELGSRQYNSPIVFVVPAFELSHEEAIDMDGPIAKQDLAYKMTSEHSSLTPFAQKLCSSCHMPTDFPRWLRTNASFQIEYTYMYEPYTIALKTVMYDEKFNGRHLNKNMHIWDIACAGHTFVVLPDALVLHRNAHRLIPYVKSDWQSMVANWESHRNLYFPRCKDMPSGSLGETPERAADSCLQIKEWGSSIGNHTYWLKPPAYDGPPFHAFCDMLTDGGGWMLVSTQKPDGKSHTTEPTSEGIDWKLFNNAAYTQDIMKAVCSTDPAVEVKGYEVFVQENDGPDLKQDYVVVYKLPSTAVLRFDSGSVVGWEKGQSVDMWVPHGWVTVPAERTATVDETGKIVADSLLDTWGVAVSAATFAKYELTCVSKTNFLVKAPLKQSAALSSASRGRGEDAGARKRSNRRRQLGGEEGEEGEEEDSPSPSPSVAKGLTAEEVENMYPSYSLAHQQHAGTTRCAHNQVWYGVTHWVRPLGRSRRPVLPGYAAGELNFNYHPIKRRAARK